MLELLGRGGLAGREMLNGMNAGGLSFCPGSFDMMSSYHKLLGLWMSSMEVRQGIAADYLKSVVVHVVRAIIDRHALKIWLAGRCRCLPKIMPGPFDVVL